MGNAICPGQDTRFWRPEDIFDVTCGSCGKALEFFKDEGSRRCPQCGTRVANPRMSLGCAQWCEHAKECLGFDPKTVDQEDEQQTALADRLIAAMKKTFGQDQKRITHALTVLSRAEDILKEEKAEPRVVLAAAILHDIGIQEAERKHGSSAGVYQEMEGPAIAERIMKEIGLPQDTIEHVKKIVANHHSVRGMDTPEFRILWDADWLVNLPDEHPDLAGEELKKKIEKIFKTGAGKKMAQELYAGGSA
jgi:predicted RNA-binding Zn-ribbon protein involved in translation (DUF1610 family)